MIALYEDPIYTKRRMLRHVPVTDTANSLMMYAPFAQRHPDSGQAARRDARVTLYCLLGACAKTHSHAVSANPDI